MSDNSALALLTAMLVKTLEARHYHGGELLRRAGIDPAVLEHPHLRVSPMQIDRLWEVAMEASGGDLSIAIDHARHPHWNNLHMFGLGVNASATLADASERMARAYRVINPSTPVLCESSNGEFHVSCEPVSKGWVPAREIAFLALILHLWRQALHPDLRPARVQSMTVERPADAALCRHIDDFFGCHMQYGQQHIRISLPLTVAQARLPMADATFAARCDAVAASYLAEIERPPIAAAVSRCIGEGLFDKDSVAGRLGISARTLHRRLAADNLSFARVLEETRRALAENHLRSGRFAVKEVAYMLGYADAANFSRAYRSWFGRTPGSMRMRA